VKNGAKVISNSTAISGMRKGAVAVTQRPVNHKAENGGIGNRRNRRFCRGKDAGDDPADNDDRCHQRHGGIDQRGPEVLELEAFVARVVLDARLPGRN
jgi:hypothetical protein